MMHTVEEGGFVLTAGVHPMGEELCVTVTGGVAHIGSVTMATPRTSLADAQVPSATLSTFCYPGHKDDKVGNLFAQEICVACSVKTVVLCGIHYDGLAPSDLAVIMTLAKTLLGKVLAELRP